MTDLNQQMFSLGLLQPYRFKYKILCLIAKQKSNWVLP